MSVGVMIGGRYELRAPLGRGGFGAVWRGHDVTLRRDVAVKVITFAQMPPVDRDAAMRRFWREAQSVAALNHPNVVTAHDFGVHGEAAYLVMELVSGGSLADELAHRRATGAGPVHAARVVAIAAQICAGLAAAHAAGVIHRDLKPANIMTTRPTGLIKIVDFGIARDDDGVRLTQHGDYLGTLPYASPEQMQAGVIDGRSDLYSLACVLYELLSDRSPFVAEAPAEWIEAHRLVTPFPLRELMPTVPEGLATLIHQMLAKRPQERPSGAAEVAARLIALDRSISAGTVTGPGPQAPDPSAAPESGGPSRTDHSGGPSGTEDSAGPSGAADSGGPSGTPDSGGPSGADGPGRPVDPAFPSGGPPIWADPDGLPVSTGGNGHPAAPTNVVLAGGAGDGPGADLVHPAAAGEFGPVRFNAGPAAPGVTAPDLRVGRRPPAGPGGAPPALAATRPAPPGRPPVRVPAPTRRAPVPLAPLLPPYPTAPRPRNALATAGLVFGILPLPLFGLVFGFAGLSRARRIGGYGRTRAVVGVVLALLWAVPLTGIGIGFLSRVARALDTGCQLAASTTSQLDSSLKADAGDPKALVVDVRLAITQYGGAATRSRSPKVAADLQAIVTDLRDLLPFAQSGRAPGPALQRRFVADGNALKVDCS